MNGQSGNRAACPRIFPFAMTKRTHLSHCAIPAIVAALALGSTPLLAQDAAAPSVVVPPPVSAPPVTTSAPAPIPAPAPAPEPETVMTSNPVVQDVPREIVVPDVPAQAAPEPVAEAAPAPETSPAPRVASAASAAPESVAPADMTTPDEAIVPPVAPVTVDPVGPEAAPLPVSDTAEPASDASLGLLAALLGAIAVVALAVWGFVAIGRRRHGRAPMAAAVPVVERPTVAERQAEPAAAAPLATREATVTPLASPRATATASTGGMAHTGAAVSLPGRVPESFEERDALLRRMIEAKPDRANPFVSPLQRRKRARLILQSLGRDFGEAEPWIDFSQYPSNWPELAARKRAAA